MERTGKRLSEYLQRTAADVTQCTWCGTGELPKTASGKVDRKALVRDPEELHA